MAGLEQILSLFLALVACSAGAHKLLARARTRAATEALLPDALRRMAGFFWVAAIAVEFAGALLLLSPFARIGAALLAGLWASYAALLARAGAVDCGCSFGVRGGRSRPARAAVLATIAAALACVSRLQFDPVAILPALALFTLDLAGDQLGNNLVRGAR